MPKRLAYYYYADVWFEDQPQLLGKKYLALEEHKLSKIREYFLLKSFYAL